MRHTYARLDSLVTPQRWSGGVAFPVRACVRSGGLPACLTLVTVLRVPSSLVVFFYSLVVIFLVFFFFCVCLFIGLCGVRIYLLLLFLVFFFISLFSLTFDFFFLFFIFHSFLSFLRLFFLAPFSDGDEVEGAGRRTMTQ